MGGNCTANPCRISGYLPSVLTPPAFVTTPVGAVTPAGWLKDELDVQAAGLSGFLPKFWADIANSSWIGGTADGGLHERTPYWMNGIVPLSYLTGDPNLIALREQYIGAIMAAQAPSGWLGIDDLATDGNQVSLGALSNDRDRLRRFFRVCLGPNHALTSDLTPTLPPPSFPPSSTTDPRASHFSTGAASTSCSR